jgi:hypothetical protein
MEYRLDKSYFKNQTFHEADHNEKYWVGKSIEDRLSAAWYLACLAYNLSYEDPPPMNKTLFKMKKRNQ